MTTEPEDRDADQAEDNGSTLATTAELVGALLKVPKREADEVHRSHSGDWDGSEGRPTAYRG